MPTGSNHWRCAVGDRVDRLRGATHGTSVVTLILIGVGLSSFAGAAMNLMMNLAPNPFSLADMVNWMLGSVANRSFLDLAFAAPFLVAGLGVLFTVRRGLSALTLGEEAASGVGLNLRRQRLLVVLGAGPSHRRRGRPGGYYRFYRHCRTAYHSSAWSIMIQRAPCCPLRLLAGLISGAGGHRRTADAYGQRTQAWRSGGVDRSARLHLDRHATAQRS